MNRRGFLRLIGTAALAMAIGLPKCADPSWELRQMMRMYMQTIVEVWSGMYRAEYLKLSYQWDRPWYKEKSLHISPILSG